MSTSKTPLEIVFGAMTFGRAGEEQVRTSKIEDCEEILDLFQSHGHNEIDTSRFYGGGSSEEYLAQLKWQDRGLTMDTKFFPNVRGIYGRPVTHLSPENMRSGLEDSLSALNTDSVDVWYLHAPDRSVPIQDTLKCLNEMYNEGKFKRWGVSNFMAWEVAQICEIGKDKGYPLPSMYQGMYSTYPPMPHPSIQNSRYAPLIYPPTDSTPDAVHRTIESELLPCLRHYNISFYAFNPLAGGWLTDRYSRSTSPSSLEAGSRFDTKTLQGQAYRVRFWNEPFLNALELLRSNKGDMRESEVALRWMVHHSQLSREKGDKVIIGASSREQLEMNLGDLEKGPLGEEVLEALDKGWEGCKGITGKYFH